MLLWVFGANGQLGSDLMPLLRSEHFSVQGFGRQEVDLAQAHALETLKGSQSKPNWIINCAAMTNTGACEQQIGAAYDLNARVPAELAAMAKEFQARIIHISTDYVFAGDQKRPWSEEDATRPLNMYGVSKLAGELGIRYRNPNHYIIRSSSLYGTAGAGAKGGNFVESMIAKAKAKEKISIVQDQWMSPTHTADLAQLILNVVKAAGNFPFGTYHFANAGQCSWYEFGLEIFRQLNLQPDVAAVSAGDFPSILQRPAYSVLNTQKVAACIKLKPWQTALNEYLRKKGHIA